LLRMLKSLIKMILGHLMLLKSQLLKAVVSTR